MLKRWNEIPAFMRTPEVKKYWKILYKRRSKLYIKRMFDVLLALLLLVFLAIPMVVIAVLIKLDSNGPVFFRQDRVTAYGKVFRMHKFRTMVVNADKKGSLVTVSGDSRITKIGLKLRPLRLDELPQLFDIIKGDMSFVGTRPEVEKYVQSYKPEYLATLLLPAGVTSEASIKYKDEDRLLEKADDIDAVYIDEILPSKMKYNLNSIREFSIMNDLKTMVLTVLKVA